MWRSRPLWLRAARGSLLEPELQRCGDGAAVLRLGASSQLPLTAVDLESFLARLTALRRMPIAGQDLRGFLAKVSALLPRLPAREAHRALTAFAALRCRQGAVAAWPLVRRAELPAESLAEAVWAASAVPQPPKEMLYEAVGLARTLAPQLPSLSDEALGPLGSRWRWPGLLPPGLWHGADPHGPRLSRAAAAGAVGGVARLAPPATGAAAQAAGEALLVPRPPGLP